MKNAIKYYYNMNPAEIHRVNEKIKFNYNNKNYILYLTKKKKEELIEKYELHQILLARGIYCHKIILNINNELVTIINNNNYILLEVNVPNAMIEIKDIIYYSNVKIELGKFLHIQRQNWKKLWSDKINYFEYQINHFKQKYKKLNENSDYYIGIVENCISLFNNIGCTYNYLSINHNRINKKTTLEEFYNPLEFILDIRVRDIGEYIKSMADKQLITLKQILNYKILNINEIKQLFIRILYPSSFFDICDDIIDKKINEYEIEKYEEGIETREIEIKKIYHYIRSISDLPEIEWLN